VRREVWTRDQGCCGFVGEDGRRCNETRGLEVAHIHPWAKDGANTAINLGLRCIAHNAWEADRDYGTSHMTSSASESP
jgi:5-methylcytosine-specific restriction endonuclease McrA